MPAFSSDAHLPRAPDTPYVASVAATGAYCVRRLDAAEMSLGGGSHDYADAFAVELEAPDAHSPEQWARVALEQASPVVRRIIRFAQVRVLRLQLQPSADTGAVLGWPVVASTVDTVHLQAAGRLLSGDIVGRRLSPQLMVLTTSLTFERRLAGLLWVVVGPLHRRIAADLLRRAAASLTAGARQK
jgi:hypothetical protein